MIHWPDKTTAVLDPLDHAIVILEALDGDYQLALANLDACQQMYSEDYCRRLGWLLEPKGEA